jgi:hypothetical protein
MSMEPNDKVLSALHLVLILIVCVYIKALEPTYLPDLAPQFVREYSHLDFLQGGFEVGCKWVENLSLERRTEKRPGQTALWRSAQNGLISFHSEPQLARSRRWLTESEPTSNMPSKIRCSPPYIPYTLQHQSQLTRPT